MAKTKQRFVRLIRGVSLVLGVVLALVLVPSTAKAATTTYTTASSDGSLSTYSNISQALSVAKQTGRPIAIDPGHGGSDPGASANGMKEADLTWKIAQACKDYLESRGVTVYLTRGQDEYVSVYDRVERAVENNCCAIVSIHINAGGGRGAEVESTNSSSYNQDLYYAGQSLSALVLSGLQSSGLTVHGAGIITRDYPSGENSSLYEDGSVADYYGITRYARKAGILGVIIEHGFIDGTSDSAKLSNSNYLTSFGRADGAAIYDQFYSSDTWWSVSGINVSTTEAYVGEAVTYSPKIMGVGENLTYNYVWAKPDWSSWGSTVKSTGSMTTSASGTFTPTEAGTYRLFIDVCSNGTSKTTRMVTITVKNGYRYRGVKVTTDMPVVGDAVTFSANLGGCTAGLTYNYVWQLDGSWAKGDWGSTVLSTGSDTSETSGSFTPAKAGTYNLYVDVVSPDGTRETRSTTVEVKDGHVYNGVTVSTASPVVGSPVTFSANLGGCTAGLTYNYVWQLDGSWAKGDWGSTVLSTGSDTSETSGSFTPAKAGTYNLYVDVVSPDGTRETRSTTVEVKDGHVYNGVTVTTASPTVGSPVTFSANVSGATAGLTYNYVWQLDGSWAKGEWGSTVLSTGSDTSDASGSFTPAKAGTYTLYVDVVSPDGTRETRSTTVEVSSAAAVYNGVKVKTTAPARGYPVTFSADVSGDTSGFTYNYVWSYEGSWVKGEWGSTVLSTGSETSDATGSFIPEKTGSYTLYVDVVGPNGKTETKSATIEVVEPTPILGDPQVTKAQLVSNLKAGLKARNATFPSDVYSAYGASTVEEFIDKLWEAAVAEGVRPEVVYAQAMVETGYLQFGGDVKIEQCNFCGLGATGSGNSGADFSSYGSDAIYIGFLAQAQHLRAYAGYAPLSSKTYDPRYGTWLFGRSYTVEGLSGTWATDTSYANSIKAVLNNL
ncbi:N-acetylmuramoyl-L-alanine amidase [Tractidigestivibacter scatoligenes]|uniref:N-acetylmuramoyl-L-alanine amidase n=1 Tax=Tractidigestivibacter scatoligenes TaxID=1299998 RepID=UPI000B1F9FE1|nr:N-acetylmuramoyl-L-alanine amidase [Tractidigestivibacter scatoligenes]